MAFRIVELTEYVTMFGRLTGKPIERKPGFQFFSYIYANSKLMYHYFNSDGNVEVDGIKIGHSKTIKEYDHTAYFKHIITGERYKYYDGKSSTEYWMIDSNNIHVVVAGKFLLPVDWEPIASDGSYSSIDSSGRSWRDRPPMI